MRFINQRNLIDINDWQEEEGGTKELSTYDHLLCALDAKAGKEKWKFMMGSEVESSPCICEGVIFFGCDDGYLYALH